MAKSNGIHFRRRHDTYEQYVAWYRVTFIGEAHMLSREAWESLVPRQVAA